MKKRTFFYGLFLLMSSYHLYAAKSVSPPYTEAVKDHTIGLPRVQRKLLANGYCRPYRICDDILLIVILFIDDDRLTYKNKALPPDLSEQDLSDFDFTGCAFTGVKLTETILKNVILTGTTCDYQAALERNFDDRFCDGKPDGNDKVRKEKLRKVLESITRYYPKLKNNAYKAKLLQIACGLSELFRYYNGLIFQIKLEYWSCCLLLLKDQLPKEVSKNLIYLLQPTLEEDIKCFCWTTTYPQDKLTLHKKVFFKMLDTSLDQKKKDLFPSYLFTTYLTDFTEGLKEYNCQSKYEYAYDYYKEEIQKNIKGLAKAYPNIGHELKKEACQIAYALSRSYEVQKETFLHHYLYYQNRLIRLHHLTKLRGIYFSSKVMDFTNVNGLGSIWK